MISVMIKLPKTSLYDPLASVVSSMTLSLQHALAGSLGGAGSMALTYPLEQIRTRMQAGESLQDILRGTTNDFHSLGTLYTGCRSVIETVLISNFTYFFFFESSRSGSLLLSSTVAGVANVLLTEPLWKANTAIKLSARKTSDAQRSVFVELLSAIRTEGVVHQWSGVSASLALVSNPIIQFFVYEGLKAKILKKRRTLSATEAFLLGALAKAIATLATYPLQVAQTRIRASDCKMSTIDCMKKLVRDGGVQALYAGIGPKLSQTVLNAAIQFLLYEKLLAKLTNK